MLYAATGFVEYSVEQGRFAGIVGYGVMAAAYGALLAALAWLPRRLAAYRRPFLAGALLGLAAWAVGVTLFEAAALYYRDEPPGSGAQRQGEALGDFYDTSAIAFYALYGACLAAAGAAAVWQAKRSCSAVALPTTASVVAVLAWLAVSPPVVEFSNACNVGRPIVVDGYAGC